MGISDFFWCLSPLIILFFAVIIFGSAAVFDYKKQDVKIPLKYYKLQPNDMEGYKVLKWNGYWWTSPEKGTEWIDGMLESDRKASKGSSHGIYIGKSPEDVESYLRHSDSRIWRVGFKVDKEYPVVERERGYQATFSYQVEAIEWRDEYV